MGVEYTFQLTRKSRTKTMKTNSLVNGNQIISANDRMHFRVKGPITAYLRQLGHDAGLKKRPKQMYSPENKCFIGIKVSAPTNARMDSPNLYPTVKALEDGLTDAGIWTDDNDSVITSRMFIPQPKNDTGKYILTLCIYDGDWAEVFGGLLTNE